MSHLARIIPLDIAIVLDNSNVIEEWYFRRYFRRTALAFVSDLYELYDMAQGDITISIISFSLQPRILLPLNGTVSESNVKFYLENIEYNAGEAANFTSLLYALG